MSDTKATYFDSSTSDTKATYFDSRNDVTYLLK